MPEWAWVWRAWQDLDSSRVVVPSLTAVAGLGGVSIRTEVLSRPISRAAMEEWTRQHDLGEDEADDLRHLLVEMEREFRLIEAERRATP